MPATPIVMYIDPILNIHSTFADAQEFYDNLVPGYHWGMKDSVGIAEVTQGQRNLIAGEPGVGKSCLLEEIRKHLSERGVTATTIQLRRQSAMDDIDAFLKSDPAGEHALLLDGLDEVRASSFPAVLERLDDLGRTWPALPIYLSSRWLFIKRHNANFSTYRFITISPFTRDQVRQYLADAGYGAPAVESLLARVMSFQHNMLVIQIPRYLSLLVEFLKTHVIDSPDQLSRNELFEHFIYAKLEIEDGRLNADKRHIVKRLLEKLALTLEIYQTNSIRKDELMTIVDDLESDLMVAALSQVDLQVLFDKTLLKDNHDSIEFDNTEFQEYLAAKEITRFADPLRAAFAFSVDKQINEFQPSWFNALTFLVDMEPGLLELFAEFSGIRGSKIVDEEFLRFLSRVNPRNVSPALKKRLFIDLLSYHQRHVQWITAPVASSLPGLFDVSLEESLKSEVDAAKDQKGAQHFVRLGNVAAIVGHLLNAKASLDRVYWRELLLALAAEGAESPVLVRYALFALEELGDPGVVDELPATLLDGDGGIAKALLRLCTALNSENPTSLQYFIKATLRREIDARYGFYALKSRNSLKMFLENFNSDAGFRCAFLEHSRTFNDQDREIVASIRAVCDDELAKLSEAAVVHSLHWQTAHYAAQSPFILGLGKLLDWRDPSFLLRVIQLIRASQPPGALYYAEPVFLALVEGPGDLTRVVAALAAAVADAVAFSVLLRVKSGGTEWGGRFFDAARAFLPQQYADWEEHRKTAEAKAVADKKQLLEDFRRKLGPEPGPYYTDVFSFFEQHADELEPMLSIEDRRRLEKLIVGSVFCNVNPADYELTITKEHGGGATTFTMSSNVGLFRDAFLAAKQLGMNVKPFRQAIISYIPFAWSDDLRAVFDLVGNVTLVEFAPVISRYKDRKSDLWRHLPANLIETVERFHLVDAVPALKSFVTEPALPPYVRERALAVVESLAPDKEFLKTVARECASGASPGSEEVAQAATNLLIPKYADAEAIRGRLQLVVDRAAPFILPRGAHQVGRFEEEIAGGNSFAKPLMQLRAPGYEEDYLTLIDYSIALWARGNEYYQYATYLWDIAYAYFENLKETGSYAPLQTLERKVATIEGKEGANWLAIRMATLRRAYISFLGKPQNIGEAIRSYNDARRYAKKTIANSQDLAQHLREAIDSDLARWIEAEGAYDVLQAERLVEGKQQYEKLIQKTIKSQVENILLKRGFQVDVYREPQLLDDKRPDMLVRYGFAGPVIIEIKLTSNNDLRTTKPEQSVSYANMKQYLRGFGASRGILLIIDNKPTRNLQRAKDAFTQIPNVWVRVFDCRRSRKP